MGKADGMKKVPCVRCSFHKLEQPDKSCPVCRGTGKMDAGWMDEGKTKAEIKREYDNFIADTGGVCWRYGRTAAENSS